MAHQARPFIPLRIRLAGVILSLLVPLGAAHAGSGGAQPAHDGHACRAADPPGSGPGHFADLSETIVPAVIAVSAMVAAATGALPGRLRAPQKGAAKPARRTDRVLAPNEVMSVGSGFFISPDGYAVTNSHVVEASDVAEIRTSDNTPYSARVVGRDALSDLALIKVDGRSDFSCVRLADQPPRVGDWVLAAGNSFGLGISVVAGIVSARERQLGAGADDGFVQIDAPINKGDSGGPSFNARGEVIGVNSMILSPSGGSAGVAFAIPAETVRTVIPQLKARGMVTRGWIGADVQSITPDLAGGLGMPAAEGVIVVSVRGNGPAARAGMRSGDVIASMEQQPVRSANELTKRVHAAAPGSSTRFTVLRQGKESSVHVTVGELSAQAPDGAPRR